MIRLRDLLTEDETSQSKAAKKAKSKGLKAGSFGKWIDNHGTVKGRTVDGEFVPVKGNEKGQSDAPLNKPKAHTPATMTQKQAGTVQPRNQITPMAQDGKKAVSKKDDQTPVDDPNTTTHTPTATTQTNLQGAFQNQQPSDSVKNPPPSYTELENKVSPDRDTNNLRKEIIPGERIRYFDEIKKFETHLHQTVIPYIPQIHDLGYHVSKMQTEAWRNTLSQKMQQILFDAQYYWQRGGNPGGSYNPKEAKHYGKQINKIIQKAKILPSIKIKIPIVRGMSIDAQDIKNFLGNFGIAREIESPPSSWTINAPMISIFANSSQTSVGVFLRIFPNKNSIIYGLALNNPDTPAIENKQEHIDYLKQYFSKEHEIMRYPNVRARCVNIDKLIVNDETRHSYTKFYYVIDMEELDGNPREYMLKEHVNPMNDSLYVYYMQRPMRKFNSQPKKLKELMPKNETEYNGPYSDERGKNWFTQDDETDVVI
jgi:hypothetical protein